MELIDKSAIVAEIERNINAYNEKKKHCPSNTQVEAICDNKVQVLKYILSFLDTLEVKKMDLENLQKELDKAVKIYKPIGDFGWGTLYNIATDFYELGMQVSNKVQKGEEI